jgi:hypothetical protein
MHAENYGAIWKHEWINFASSLTQDRSSLFNIQTNVSSALNIAALSLRTFEKSSLLWFSNLGQYIRKWSSPSVQLYTAFKDEKDRSFDIIMYVRYRTV